MTVLLLSTYDLGRQPFGLASPAAWLRDAAVDVRCADLSREPLPETDARLADVVGFFLPMHTATRLAVPVIDRVRALNPRARLAAYGLYAVLNAALLRAHGIDALFGGEFERELTEFVLQNKRGQEIPREHGRQIPRLAFRVPDRSGLPSLARYATLQAGSDRHIVGYTEASRGCKHRCRHCPIVPVYDGRFRVVPADVVIADIASQVARGATHITFGDPDFFNGIRHASAVLSAFAQHFPAVTYDVTIKIEHLLEHADMLPTLRTTGCAFVTSAVESLDDSVLARLEKGHTRADFEQAVALCRNAGLTLAPTFVPFTPWTTLAAYCDLLDAIDRLELVDAVAPIQLAIRLLVTEGSRLLELDDVRGWIGSFDPVTLTYPWRHADPRVDQLQQQVTELIGVRLTGDRDETFMRIWEIAHEATALAPPRRRHGVRPRTAIPYLNEPWYC